MSKVVKDMLTSIVDDMSKIQHSEITDEPRDGFTKVYIIADAIEALAKILLEREA
jgi:hypothetical protein